MLRDAKKEAEETALLSTLKDGLAELKQLWLGHTTNGKHLREGESQYVSAMAERAEQGGGVVIKLTWKRVIAAVSFLVLFIGGLSSIAVNLLRLHP